MDYQIKELRKTRRAANKYIQEHEARGESFEEIAKALQAHGYGTLHPKHQRGRNT